MAGESRRVIGYARVSTDGQGISLEVQRQAIEAECRRRHWTLVEVVEDTCSGKTLDRPGAQAVFAALRAGSVDVLMVHKVDRLSRSLVDFAGVLARTSREGWQLVALDLGVDTTTPNGRFMAQIMAAVAELEREMIAQRTRDALAAKKAQGVHCGRRSTLPIEVVARIVGQHRAKVPMRVIADRLNEDGVPTGQGAPAWTKRSVRDVLATSRARRMQEEDARSQHESERES